MEISDSNMKSLKRGDMTLIAEMTGYSYIMVRKTVKGERHNKIIEQTAQKLAESRQQLSMSIPKRRK